jgi:hypothetical protein
MDITPCGVVKQPPTKAKHVKTLSPRKDYVSLTTVLIHIYILGMAYRDQSALSYRVGLSPTVECKLSRIMGK